MKIPFTAIEQIKKYLYSDGHSKLIHNAWFYDNFSKPNDECLYDEYVHPVDRLFAELDVANLKFSGIHKYIEAKLTYGCRLYYNREVSLGSVFDVTQDATVTKTKHFILAIKFPDGSIVDFTPDIYSQRDVNKTLELCAEQPVGYYKTIK